MVKYPDYNGNWETDPLDLKSLRHDAELDERYNQEGDSK